MGGYGEYVWLCKVYFFLFGKLRRNMEEGKKDPVMYMGTADDNWHCMDS